MAARDDRPELAQHVMVSRGMNTADKKLVWTMTKRVGSCLRQHRAAGLLRSEKGAGQVLVWETAS